jgi:type IV pilus assembly protein PilA
MSRSRLADPRGFSLPELLVLVMIVGILAAVALAAFLSQQGKAHDADAKSAVATAATAMEDYNSDRAGYGGATPAQLVAIEPGLRRARGLSVQADHWTYTVSVVSAGPGGAFSMERRADGEIVRDCTHPGAGGCGDRTDAQGNRW